MIEIKEGDYIAPANYSKDEIKFLISRFSLEIHDVEFYNARMMLYILFDAPYAVRITAHPKKEDLVRKITLSDLFPEEDKPEINTISVPVILINKEMDELVNRIVNDAVSDDKVEPLTRRVDEWDGKGLPPVGCECVIHAAHFPDDFEKDEYFSDGDPVYVVAHEFTEFDEKVAIVWNKKTYCARSLVAECFRPINTRTDREKAIEVMQDIIGGQSCRDAACKDLFERIKEAC